MNAIDSSFVCSEHFTKDCFETNLAEEVTGKKARRTLKKGAIPSVFSFGPEPKQPRLASVARAAAKSSQAELHVST